MEYSGLILAAGSGRRIAKKINTPKCLIKVNNRAILEHQLISFEYAGIKNIYIITGYQEYKIKNFLKKLKINLKIKLVQNNIYKKTNNMYSAHLASKFLKNKKFILCNGDVIIEKEIIKKLVDGKRENEILTDKFFFDEESMKVKMDISNRVTDINKKIKKKNSLTSIDFYKFSENASNELFKEIKNHLATFGKKDWTEVAIKKIFSKCNFYSNNIINLKWCEIDTYKDLVFAENKFKELNHKIFKKYSNFIVDIDGTTFKKNIPIEGTLDFLNKIKKQKKKIVFLSNNSSLDFKSFQKLFKRVKFKITKSNIINSTNVLVNYLKERKIKKVYATGNKKFIKELKKNKITIDTKKPSLVVVSYDDEINYKKLQLLCELLNKNIPFVSTHDDSFYPGKNGPIPDAGSTLSLIKTTTGKDPIKIFGKPSIEIKKLLKTNGKTLVIGDKINKDIQFAKNCNYDSALILGDDEFGVYDLNALQKKIKPNYYLSSIKDLV
jgi:HAD superfamily hydrolase (TIGR01450 family)